MLPAYITHADCARHEMGPQHPECPERLGAINDLLLVKGLLDYMHPIDAPLATTEQLAHAHSSLYVAELMDASPAEGYHRVDPDTEMNPFTVRAALRAAGAVVHATDLVVAGDAPTAFCCVRPPGHHAERGAAMGFCFFNNIAVGIRHALTTHGIQRVALIDFDVHHGNGSEDIFRGDERFLDVHTSGTLADLAQTRADLAMIALPPGEVIAPWRSPGASSAVPRWSSPAASTPRWPANCTRSHGATASTCWGPTRWASSARSCSSTPASPGRWPPAGRWGWCRSPAR
jgi:hypothetical protein